MPKNIAIFSTSDIQRCYRNGENDNICSTNGDLTFYTTGKLENALNQGYNVIVITTRRGFQSHDTWWLDLVGRENVFFGQYGGYGANDRDYIQAWKNLYQKLGINTDKVILGRQGCNRKEDQDFYDRYPDHNHNQYEIRWMDYPEALNRVGIEIGSDF